MAIRKIKNLPNGISGDYWKVTSVSLDKPALKLTCTIALFKDENQTVPLKMSKTFKFKIEPDQVDGDLVALSYTLIKGRANTMVKVLFSKNNDLIEADPDLAHGEDV